ncbi:MAG TPA: DNA repair protein RecN [Anaerolineae bacterium]|nr:DNA repair protein RecN [Anaerolineae bacterium]
MLAELYIKNFAIIEELHLRFGPGFNVLTGETGAGKSIIVDAVSTLLGGRAETGVIRSGADEARVEGIFLLNKAMQEVILPILRRDGLEGEDEETLILAREIRRGGRSICRVNGRAVTLKVLEEIGRRLVDIHGQTEHLSLFRVREHLDLLDRYGRLWPLRERVAAKVRELRQVRQELEGLLRDERELARRADLLAYQVREIASANLRVGEEEELESERARLANAERLMELADEAYRALYEGEEGQLSAIDLLGQVARNLAELERLDPGLRGQQQVAEEAACQLEELARSLRAYRDTIEYNPARLQQVEERLDLIYGLKRKYGDSIAEILAFGEEAQRELESIVHSEERVEELRAREDALLHEIGELASRLSAERRAAGDRLAKAVEAELAELGMRGARFAVAIERREAEDGAWVEGRRYAFDERGLDRVEFLIAPNVGEPLKPLAKIASGGEASRLMLALKTVLSAADKTPILIFDEIDAGIGGRAGGVVGRKLWSLTAEASPDGVGHQVLCVTHLPQLACYGDVHFKVAKDVVGGRTIASARALSEEERVEELAAMLGTATAVTRQNARELLERVKEVKRARQ